MVNLSKLDTRKIAYVNILLASVSATFLFSMYAASAVYMGTSTTSSTTHTNQANVEYPDGNIQSVNVTATDSISMYIDTTSTGSIVYGQGSVVVTSNAAGYSLFISADSDDTALHLNGDKNNNTDIMPSTSTSNVKLENIDINSWAYSLGETNSESINGRPETYLYKSIPSLSSPTYFAYNDTSSSVHNVYFGARANRSMADGNYFGNIVYTVIAWGETTENLGYTGGEQSFKAEYDGYYKLEAWGAQGGSYNNTYIGGYGGYSTGVVKLKKDEVIYVNVGGQGVTSKNGTAAGGYNGGGSGFGSNNCCSGCGDRYAGGGGGATHIAKTSGLLSSFDSNRDKVLLVAGGGGGSFYDNDESYHSGGSGGGYQGDNAVYGWTSYQYKVVAKGGNQTAGGSIGYGYATKTGTGSFGTGQTYGLICNETAGGGAGWYGGGAGAWASGAGGSGYIASDKLINHDTTTKHMTCYKCSTSDVASTKTSSTTYVSDTAIADYSKKGNGYAKITYLGI